MVTTTTSIPIQEPQSITTSTFPSSSFTQSNTVTISPVTVSYGDTPIYKIYPKKKKYSGSLPSAIFTDAYIKEVIYNNPATIILWSDGTKTVSKCHSSDTYSKETGLMLCVIKKLIGSTRINDILRDWIPEQESLLSTRVTLADVIKKYKARGK